MAVHSLKYKWSFQVPEASRTFGPFQPSLKLNKPVFSQFILQFCFSWIIRLGDIENEELVEHKIRKIYIHPDYLLGQAYYDLAMIRVDYVDYSSTISPICLSVRPDSTGIRFVGKSVTVAGWEGFNGSNASLETSPMTVLPLRQVFLILNC